MQRTFRSGIAVRLSILIFITVFIPACNEDHDVAKGIISGMIKERSYTEVFAFEILPATGPGTIRESGNTADLLLSIPYLFASGLVPPENVINEFLSLGERNAGMSGGVRWEPYTLKPGAFEGLVQELISAYSNGPLIYRETDAWVHNFEDWHVWVMQVKHGVPWEEHKRLNDAVVAIEKAIQVARADNDEARLNELHARYLKAGTELSEYVMNYLGK